ncbi:MAG: hypothetical protein ACRC15_03470, partial [Cetobacterium sp.]
FADLLLPAYLPWIVYWTVIVACDPELLPPPDYEFASSSLLLFLVLTLACTTTLTSNKALHLDPSLSFPLLQKTSPHKIQRLR